MVTANLLQACDDVRRGLPGALPPHPRRRVPGHEPRPERDRQAPGRGARQRLRGGRLGPVGLPLARGGHPQHLGVRARLPQRDDDHVGAELPLHPDHPRCGQRRHRQQHRAPAQGALHRRRHGRPGQALPRRGRARRGGLGLQRDPAPARVGGTDVGRLRRLLPHQRAVAAARDVHEVQRHPLQGGGRGQVLRPPGDQGRPGLHPRAGQPRRRGLGPPHRQRPQARHRRHVGGPDGGLGAGGAACPSARRSTAPKRRG